MSWFVDNATGLYILLCVIAAGLIAAWRFNQRVKFLIFAGFALAVIPIVWIAAELIGSDSRQLEQGVRDMAVAVETGRVNTLFDQIANDFDYKGLSRKALYDLTQNAIKSNKIREIRITQFKVDEVSRANKQAKVSFGVTAYAAADDRPYPFVTKADFVLEDGQWKMKGMRFFKTFVNTDQEIQLPGIP